MPSDTELIKQEIGIFLKMIRKKNYLSMDKVAKAIGYSNPNFVAKIENGKAIIPLDKIIDFAHAYELPPEDLTRLALVAMHNDIYKSLIYLLAHDKEFAIRAAAIHQTKDVTKRQERMKMLSPGLFSKTLDKMRVFIKDNEKLIPKGVWCKRLLSNSVEDL